MKYRELLSTLQELTEKDKTLLDQDVECLIDSENTYYITLALTMGVKQKIILIPEFGD
jgi:hypothetical protein